MRALFREWLFVWGAALVFVFAWRYIMPGPFDWLSWRPWVGWVLVWFGCDLYAMRKRTRP